MSGTQPFTLEVEGAAAVVDVELDGRPVGRLTSAPWSGEIDLGPALRPHRIDVRARDASGQEIGRATEWANLPADFARVELTLERADPMSPPSAVRATAVDFLERTPSSVALTFDGAPLDVDAQGRAALPPHDLDSVHVIAADVVLSPTQSVRSDLAYGGAFGAEVGSELTAVPLRVQGPLPPVDRLGGWLQADGVPLLPVAVEEGPAEIFVVRSPEAAAVAQLMARRRVLRIAPEDGRLPAGTMLHVMSSQPRRYTTNAQRGNQVTLLFDLSTAVDAQRVPLAILLGRLASRRSADGGVLLRAPRLNDAVAVAGMEAVRRGRRRAVVLVLSGRAEDESVYDPATVRGFLAALRVPLFVWSLDSLSKSATAAAWGGAEDLSVGASFGPAMARIRTELESQRVVLVGGRHLPQSIGLGPAAAGVALVGEQSVTGSWQSRTPGPPAIPRAP